MEFKIFLCLIQGKNPFSDNSVNKIFQSVFAFQQGVVMSNCLLIKELTSNAIAKFNQSLSQSS